MMKAVLRNKEDLKDSGIEWIGAIPKSWNIAPIKFSFDIFAGATPDSKESAFWDGDIPWITPADYKTTDKYIMSGRRNLTIQGLESCSATLVPKGSLIFSKRAPIGTVAISKQPLATNQGCLSCVSKGLADVDYFYFMTSIATEEFELSGAGTTFKEISTSKFSNFKMPCPEFEEQTSISKYLNDHCAKIDTIIAEAKASIEEYKELKQAVIYETVTKGLDKTVEYKNVNLYGIKQIPKNWKKIKIGWFCSFINGDRSEKYPSGNDFQDTGIPFIGADSLNELFVNKDNCRYITQRKYDSMGGLKIQKDDILYTLRGSTIGKCAIANFDNGTVASSLTGIRVKNKDMLYPMFFG